MTVQLNSLALNCGISNVLTMEILQSCAKLSNCNEVKDFSQLLGIEIRVSTGLNDIPTDYESRAESH